MAIELLVSAPNAAALGYHEIKSATASWSMEGSTPTTSVIVHSWKDAESKIGGAPISWQWSLDKLVAISDFDNLSLALITAPDSPFFGGKIYTTLSGIEAEKAKKWAWVKVENARRNTLPLQTSFGVVQCDEASQYEILKAVVMANNLEMVGYPVEIPFTLADNTVMVLDAEMTVGMGFAMGARQQELRARRNELRDEIDAAEMVEEVQRITWDLAPVLELMTPVEEAPAAPNEVPA